MITQLDILYAKRLRELRVLKGIKQLEACELLSLSQQEYSKLETGKKHFSEAIIETIINQFKIPPEQFTGKIEFSNADFYDAHDLHSGKFYHSDDITELIYKINAVQKEWLISQQKIQLIDMDCKLKLLNQLIESGNILSKKVD